MWMPIETAPRDGTSILLYGPEDEENYEGCGVVWYCHYQEAFVEGDLGPIEDGCYTHWMPLPAPPQDPE